MKRSNEFAVGLSVLAALALVIGGALWLSETDVNQKEATYTARFRTVGGLGVGAPVTLRGVRVGRVEAIRLAPDRSMVENLAALGRGELDAAQVFQPFAEAAVETGGAQIWYAAASRGPTSYTTFYAPRRLAHDIERIERLIKHDGGEAEQVEAGLH